MSHLARAPLTFALALQLANCDPSEYFRKHPKEKEPRSFHYLAQLGPCTRENSSRPSAPPAQIVRRAYDGPAKPREETATLLLKNEWVEDTSREKALVWLTATTLDGRPDVWEEGPYGDAKRVRLEAICDFSVCSYVGLLPGSHSVVVSGKASAGAKQTEVFFSGQAEFFAEAGGLYSTQVCQPQPGVSHLVWVRNDSSLKCASAVCPPL